MNWLLTFQNAWHRDPPSERDFWDVELSGFGVEGRDAYIGRVEQGGLKDGFGFLVVEPVAAVGDGLLLLPSDLIDSIDVEDRRVFLARTRERIRNAPRFDPITALLQHLVSLGEYYEL